MEWGRRRCAPSLLAASWAAKKQVPLAAAAVASAASRRHRGYQRGTALFLRLQGRRLLAASENDSLACAPRRWAGDSRPVSVAVLSLPAVLAASSALAVPASRRHRAHELPTVVSLRLPTRGVLAAPAALGHAATSRCGVPKRTTASAVQIPSWRPLAVVQGTRRRLERQSAHLHGLRAAADRCRGGFSSWQ